MISFDEFNPSDKVAWGQAAEALLKGKPLSKLNWQFEPNLELEAYYDISDSSEEKAPGLGGLLEGNGFVNLELLGLDDQTNIRAQNALNMGAGGVFIEGGLQLENETQISAILPEHCWFGINTDTAGLSRVASFIKNQSANADVFRGYVGIPWITTLDSSTSFKIDGNDLFSSHKLISEYSGLRTIEIPLYLIQQSGGSIALELGVMLSSLRWIVDKAIAQGISIDSLPKKLIMSSAVGSDFYHEIAKLRAIRPLAFKLFKAYDAAVEVGDFAILGRTSRVLESSLDSDTNYLRKTTQAFSIVLGTADVVIVTPYEPKGYNEDARRISRNIGNLMKEESYGHWVNDPLAGSYFVESLTGSLCEAGWHQFQTIEAEGGLEAWINQGGLSEELGKEQARILEEIGNRRKTVVGVNNFPNMLDKDVVESANGQFSYAVDFERLRAQLSKSVAEGKINGVPCVQPISVGDRAAMITARLNFATNFLGCGGFEMLDKLGGDQVDASKGTVAVICGSDDDYEVLDESSIQYWKDKFGVLLIAGNPSNATALAAWGVDDFIHVRSNVLKANVSILQKLNAI